MLRCRCILEEFVKLGIGMLPKMDNYMAIETVTLSPLMEGLHTKEALQLVCSPAVPSMQLADRQGEVQLALQLLILLMLLMLLENCLLHVGLLHD
jgi:hypothetical protein